MPHSNDVPAAEEAVFDELSEIRTRLSLLKKDRSQYLNSKDVLAEYNKVLAIVKQLNEIRSKEPDAGHSTSNRVDQVLDDCFQLLSLFFITVGLTKTAPATYSSLSTVQRLLEHLSEAKVYTHHELKPIKERLDEIKEIINNGSIVDKEEDLLLKKKLQECVDEYQFVESNVQDVDPSLQSLFDKLVSIRKKILNVIAQPDYSVEELVALKEKLVEIASHRDAQGKFLSLETNQPAERGQNVLNGVLDSCYILIKDLEAHHYQWDEQLKPIHDKLVALKSSLEDLLVTRRWTLRETDLFSYQKALQEIEAMRVGGKFPSSNAESRGQTILLYLLRRCYQIIYKLLESSEPVSEALQPIFNQLSTARRCLLEVKRMGGVESARELYPYQMKLASLDNMREDGKFIVDGHIPEGQGTLNALLAECYDIVQEMKIEAEDKSDDFYA